MSNYPDAVERIVQDYLQRLKTRLSPIPEADREEFLREISSHIYESYVQLGPGEEVENILAVLRKLGDPGDVVAERLPDAMMNLGKRRKRPVYILGGILIALFGLPLGFGGVAVLVGVLAALIAASFALFASSVALALASVLIAGFGFLRIFDPVLWDRLTGLGYIQVYGPLAELLDLTSPASQGTVLIVLAMILGAAAWGLLWTGKRMLRGLYWLSSLMFAKLKVLSKKGRARVRAGNDASASALRGEAPVRI